MYSDNMKS